jgi:hypothetical protein
VVGGDHALAGRRCPRARDIVGPVNVIAMSEAMNTTIVFILIWVVLFPALVTGLIGFAIVRAIGEKRENDELRARH